MKLQEFKRYFKGKKVSAKQLPDNIRIDTDIARQLLILLGQEDEEVFWTDTKDGKVTYGLLAEGHELIRKHLEIAD